LLLFLLNNFCNVICYNISNILFLESNLIISILSLNSIWYFIDNLFINLHCFILFFLSFIDVVIPEFNCCLIYSKNFKYFNYIGLILIKQIKFQILNFAFNYFF